MRLVHWLEVLDPANPSGVLEKLLKNLTLVLVSPVSPALPASPAACYFPDQWSLSKYQGPAPPSYHDAFQVHLNHLPVFIVLMPATSFIELKARTTPTSSMRTWKSNDAQSQVKNQTLIVETVESSISLPFQSPAATTQPTRMWGCRRKVSKEAKVSMAEGLLQNWDAFPSCNVSNDHPAIRANVIPPT